MKSSSNRGFTLIELLVVIAIIGLLAAVILASLSGARNKGADATVKQQLDSMRAAAELFATNANNSYSGLCTANSSAANPGVNDAITAANKVTNTNAVTIANGTIGTQAAETAQVAICADGKTAWVAQAPLTGSGNYWCVDSVGASKQEAAVLPANATHCT